MNFLILFLIIIIFSTSFSEAINFSNKKSNILYSQIKKIDTKIGVVDFRSILKNSKTMKKVGKEYLKYEKVINDKIKNNQIEIKKEEKKLLNSKNNLKKEDFDKKKKLLKQKITKLQKFSIEEKNKLKYSFQKIQKKLNNALAKIIKEISKRKGIDIVILKENIFLYNDSALNFSSEALEEFDNKTKNLKITAVNSK